MGEIAVVGIMVPMLNGPLVAILQSIVAADMQGRVLSLLPALTTIMVPLSLAVAGPISDTLGIQIWYLLSGLICLSMGIAAFSIRPIMHLEDGNREK
jgi:DHA3 family macrolide efflux protein-like MFS transporter